ncbi:Metallo-hydrolase/oxidoreductase [Martensiomyces pterosporus]|nr:Metallo-hydrolase/oxidoreductase [Martensiomyces pterosporus]
MSRAFGVGLGWLKANRTSTSVYCIGAIAGYTVYCLIADQWISNRRQLVINKRKASHASANKMIGEGGISGAAVAAAAATIDTDSAVSTARSPPPLYESLFIGGRFVNPFDTWRDKTLWDFICWLVTRRGGNGLPSDRSELEKDLPLVLPHYTLLDALSRSHARRTRNQQELEGSDPAYADLPDMSMLNKDKAITATWLGQSTCFVQMEGLNVLTDPIFKRRTVYSWLGPERLRPVPCQLEDLPHPDVVLVSHNHFDHLDIDVVRKLGNSVTWYVPLGLRDWFARQGVYKVKEMDWWQESEFAIGEKKFTIVATPTQHWSGRNGFDSNCSLWSSFLVKGANASLFHCGDTGYCPAFKEVGRRYGPVSLAVLPIGSYEPRWYMCHQHINPEDAVMIHRDLGARNSIGVHWGTFMMSDEHYMAPPRDLAAACAKHGLKVDEFIAPQFGRTHLYSTD